MTRTELARRELEESKRHNEEQERIGKIGNVIGAVSSIGSFSRGIGGFISGLASRGGKQVLKSTQQRSNGNGNASSTHGGNKHYPRKADK